MLSKIEKLVACVCVSIMAVLVFINVIARYGFGNSLAVSDEMSTYLFVLMSFMGTAVAARRKAHLGLSIVTDHVSPRARMIISMVMYAISALFCLLIVIFGIQMVISQYQMGQETATMQWPEWIYGSFVPVGAAFAMMAFLQTMVQMYLLIVFVHYQYLEAAVRNALPMIDKHTMVLCLQNGLGNYDEIAKVVPEEQIIIGNTAFGSTPVGPGHVKHTGTGVTNLGSLKAPMAKVEEMAEGLRAAGLEVQVHENVMNAIWHKLLANVAINGMSALLETKNGFVDGNQYAHEAARMLVEEAIVVANACGCTLDHDAELEHAYEVSRMTDETISSMVQDVTHHRETEIRIITGAVCRLGREHGIPTPCNDLMLQLVLAKQSIYLGR